MYNPSLRKTPRHEPADVIPMHQEVSILDWLESTGRMLPKDAVQYQDYPLETQEDDIEGLMEGEDYVEDVEADDDADDDFEDD